ncbi:hypothetical protein Plhal304r1_c019g0067351 [Plasmopara halstedii]
MAKSDWNFFFATLILSGRRREKLESGCYQGTGNKKGTQQGKPKFRFEYMLVKVPDYKHST